VKVHPEGRQPLFYILPLSFKGEGDTGGEVKKPLFTRFTLDTPLSKAYT
jgi:hypothetical protein